MSEAARLFDGERLRASLHAGGGERAVFVTFRQRLREDGGFEERPPVAQARNLGYAHLHLQARLNDWYVNPETQACAEALQAIPARFERRVGIGFSMGGFGALRFAEALGLQEVILVSPQVSIDPAIVPWDRRYRVHAAGFDPDLGRLRDNDRLTGCLLFDPSRPLDRRNAEAIAAKFPQIRLCRLGFGGHPATRVINQGLGIGHLLRLLLDGSLSRAAVRGLHVASRGKSEHYGRSLRQALDHRATRS